MVPARDWIPRMCETLRSPVPALCGIMPHKSNQAVSWMSRPFVALALLSLLSLSAVTAPAVPNGPVKSPAVAAASGATHPAQALIDRSVIEVRTDPEASKRDADSALALIRRRPDTDLEIRARLLVCDYQSERDPNAAQQQINAVGALLPGAKRSGLRAGMLICQGEMAETAGRNAESRTAYENAVTVATNTNDDEMLALSLFERGWLLGLQGEYASGLADLHRANTLFEKLKMPMHAITTLNGIATLYNRMGDYEQAKKIYTRTLKEQRAESMYRDEAVTVHNLGRTHEYLGEWNAAKEAFESALALCHRITYPRLEAYGYRGLAAVANASGDPRGALKLLEKASAIQSQIPDARLRGQILLARGVSMHQLQRLSESASALEEAAGIFRKGDSLVELSTAESELASVYAQMGNWRAAFERQTDAKSISDKLLKNQVDQRFQTLKIEFDTATKDKENQALLRENAAGERALEQGMRVRRLQATVIVLGVLLLGVLVTLAIYQHGSTLRMRKLAMTDELTGVPNRRAVLVRLDPVLSKPSDPPCSILIIDIDHFKSINDHHGHAAGDQVLKVVAERVRSGVIEPAFFGRLGGEEFLVVLPGVVQDPALQMAESFRNGIMSLDTGRWFADRRSITASIGVATSSPGGDTVSSILQRADAALYAAKRSGRNCVRCEPDMPSADWKRDAQVTPIAGVT
jgi:diguanylate cyclase (GGDEF)-like protein